jgi:3-hydroxybutyryl-CoA dehydratase
MSYEFQGMYFEDWTDGYELWTASRTVTEGDIMAFAGVSGDFNPLHTNEVFASSTPMKTRIAHGMLGVAVATGLANQTRTMEGTTMALISQTLNYKAPIFPGDTVTLRLTVDRRKLSSKGGKGVVWFKMDLFNQRDEVVTDGEWVLLMKAKG